ncbi:MAG: tRNA pseudouridine(55) synthase TruB [Alphaproteobacteria bacterium]|jgi:tRNA pseudouridine55 synthase|nr:tRNA pseudouridine(55) synthase TruB [Alphaproteobacteria bacterium]
MGRRRKGRPVHGWLVLDKPADMTSTEALGKVRRLFGAAKAGHAGTLDPMATGVLPIAFGEATKTVPYAMDATKVYRFSVRWGEARDTDDSEGAVTATSPVRPSREAIEEALPAFIGEIEQLPPIYSAIKVGGERSYDLARDGQAVELTPRPVRIDDMRLVEMTDADHAVFEVVSGKGAYMRALARDLAADLGTVGHLSVLRRLCVGPFTLDEAVTLGHLERLAEGPDLDGSLLPVDRPLVDIPAVSLTEAEAHRVRCGQPVGLMRRSDRSRLQDLMDNAMDPDRLVLVRQGTQPVALARLEGGELKPVRILNL